MLEYCVKKWDKNQKLLEAAITKHPQDYRELVQLVVRNILNDGVPANEAIGSRFWDESQVVEIDHGDYQGTLMYLIPRSTYQPSCDDYLITYAWYGSCSGCDSLMAICDYNDEAEPTMRAKADYLMLCKDIVANIVKPYNHGWREEEEFKPVEFK